MPQKACRKALLVARGLLAHEAGHKTRDRLKDGQGGRLAAVEHNVANSQGLQGKEPEEPGIKALVAAADNGDVLLQGQLAHELLAGRTAVGGHAEHAAGMGQGAQRPGHGVYLHDHAGASAIGAIVHMPVPVPGKGSRVREVDGNEALFQGPFHEPCLQCGGKEGRKQADNVEAEHGHPSSKKIGKAGQETEKKEPFS